MVGDEEAFVGASRLSSFLKRGTRRGNIQSHALHRVCGQGSETIRRTTAFQGVRRSVRHLLCFAATGGPPRPRDREDRGPKRSPEHMNSTIQIKGSTGPPTHQCKAASTPPKAVQKLLACARKLRRQLAAPPRPSRARGQPPRNPATKPRKRNKGQSFPEKSPGLRPWERPARDRPRVIDLDETAGRGYQ